jgi:RNA polymerase sigma-70 factor (ECF subfamily)
MPGPFFKRRRTHPTDSGATVSSAWLQSEERERNLLYRVATQDRQAFETLYRQYVPRLYRYLSRFIPQPDIIEEVLDDIMLVVWQNAARFDGTARASTWILGIAYYKMLKARARLSKPPVDLPPTPEWSQAHNPEELLKYQDLQCELARAIEHLSPEQRMVVELTFYQGCSYQEIATIMGCPVNTVKTRMWHARQYITQALTGFRTSVPSAPQSDASLPHQRRLQRGTG